MSGFYYRRREEALEAAACYEDLWHVRASFEPYNGWVIILSPLDQRAFEQPLAPLLDKVEIDLTAYQRLFRRPEGYKPPPPPTTAATKKSKPPPPPPPPPAPRPLAGSGLPAGADTRPAPAPRPPDPPPRPPAPPPEPSA